MARKKVKVKEVSKEIKVKKAHSKSKLEESVQKSENQKFTAFMTQSPEKINPSIEPKSAESSEGSSNSQPIVREIRKTQPQPSTQAPNQPLRSARRISYTPTSGSRTYDPSIRSEVSGAPRRTEYDPSLRTTTSAPQQGALQPRTGIVQQGLSQGPSLVGQESEATKAYHEAQKEKEEKRRKPWEG